MNQTNLNLIYAPFSDEQIEKFNQNQENGNLHPYTCGSPEDILECLRAVKEVDGQIIMGTSDGILKATREGLVCPCGKYVQNWFRK